jgi:hypothetical protein
MPIEFSTMMQRKSNKAWAFSSTIGGTVRVVVDDAVRARQRDERSKRLADRAERALRNQRAQEDDEIDEGEAEQVEEEENELLVVRIQQGDPISLVKTTAFFN